MGFPFEEVCLLLSRLEDSAVQLPPLSRAARHERTKEIIIDWCKSHRNKITELDADSLAALLSTLLPEWRTDRVYGIQSSGLFRMLCRVLNVSCSTRPLLEAYKTPGNGDLGVCLERAMSAGGTVAQPAVSLEEVDGAMHTLAGGSIFSDPSIPRLPAGSSGVRDKLLGDILKRMQPRQGKWFARLIMKDFGLVLMDEDALFRGIHFLLPGLLQFHRDFTVAASMLRKELSEYHAYPDPRSQRLLREQAAKKLKPQVGTKIGRPQFHKARSIDHCLNMLGSKAWVIERKYDGEYCEIHVDLRWSRNTAECIKIFSKSGKNSTGDRAKLLPILIKALRLGEKECCFKRQAILLGEMVIFSDKDDCVLPFETIRKHVTRSGRQLGTDADSQPNAHEHPAIVFFDLLQLDDEVVMSKSVEERRIWLRKAYHKIHGRAMSAEWKTIEFDESSKDKRRLVEQFAASIARRCEGLVLKPCQVPYFGLEGATQDYARSYIKLKKDYINGLGDEADFAVIGASYNAQQATTSGTTATQWTSFHLGCLVNKTNMRRAESRPIFKHVGSILQDKCIPAAILEAANTLTRFGSKPCVRGMQPTNFDIQAHPLFTMDVALDVPFVFEVLGSGFEKPSNCRYLMLRHPRVKKLHEDRGWEDCVTFDELQEQGAATREGPTDSESQETRTWINKLERDHKKKLALKCPTTPSSRRTTTPFGSIVSTPQQPSPRNPGSRRPQDVVSHTHVDAFELPSSATAPSHEHAQRPASAKRSIDDLRDLTKTENVIFRKRQRIETSVAKIQFHSTALISPLSVITTNTDAQTQRNPPRMMRRTRAVTGITSKIIDFFQPSSQGEARQDSLAMCHGSRCAFDNTAVFLIPCIVKTPYITDDLLGLHNATITMNLAHWDRDSFAHAPLTEIVPESQSHGVLRKIILVEKGRQSIVRSLVQELLNMNGGKFRERIEVYDWRALEVCGRHDQAPNFLKKHFLGATLFDDTRQRVVFAANCEWLGRNHS